MAVVGSSTRAARVGRERSAIRKTTVTTHHVPMAISASPLNKARLLGKHKGAADKGYPLLLARLIRMTLRWDACPSSVDRSLACAAACNSAHFFIIHLIIIISFISVA